MDSIDYHIIQGHLIVLGNCQVCKERIEKAALSVKGVSFANWNISNGNLDLSFDPGITNLDEISIAIARAGHETNLHKVGQEVREQTPECCKSTRQ